MSKSAVAWLLIALGGAGAALFIIKISLIGYYPSEFVPYMILGAVSVLAIWVGDRFRKAAAHEAESNTATRTRTDNE